MCDTSPPRETKRHISSFVSLANFLILVTKKRASAIHTKIIIWVKKWPKVPHYEIIFFLGAVYRQ
jgi:hypothetical protein